MNRIKFIVAEKSYLLRKGIVSVINRIEFASVVKELDNLDTINSEILNHCPDFVVINPNLIPENKNFRNFEIKVDLHTKGIALSTGPPYRKGLLDKHSGWVIPNSSDNFLRLYQNFTLLL